MLWGIARKIGNAPEIIASHQKKRFREILDYR